MGGVPPDNLFSPAHSNDSDSDPYGGPDGGHRDDDSGDEFGSEEEDDFAARGKLSRYYENDEEEDETYEDSEEGSDLDESEFDESSSWEDTFPFEENIFALNHRYVFIENLATTKDVAVYKALDRETKGLVAIKIVDGLDGNKEPKEVRISAIVSGHPCVARMLAWFPIPSTQCYAIVSEFVEAVDREQIKPRHAALYIRDTLAALVHTQASGILYRDIKPSNMLLRRDGKGGIMIDFDCATFYDGDRNHLSQLGTEGYMAPEMMKIAAARARGVPDEELSGYGLEIDVYSTGVLLGEILFCRENEGETSKEEFLRLISLLPPKEQSAPQYDLLLKLLEDNPDERIEPTDALKHPFFQDLEPIGFGKLVFSDDEEDDYSFRHSSDEEYTEDGGEEKEEGEGKGDGDGGGEGEAGHEGGDDDDEPDGLLSTALGIIP